jgi:hypothetical protein
MLLSDGHLELIPKNARCAFTQKEKLFTDRGYF